MKKIRLDLLLVERGLAESRSMAQRLVMAGQVRVNGETVLRSAANVTPLLSFYLINGQPF
jgi:23S rRNA (cytidine1920-2'-O)/16S rRNA (cytidine1409-2'-O)-methyltransferase